MPKRERMSAVDTAWLRMDRESNLMMIVGVLVFDRPLDMERLMRTVEVRLAGRFRRFRQRVVHDLAGAWWEDDPDFHLGNHVVLETLAPGEPKWQLQTLASELAIQPLDPGHPLWRFDVIERYEGGSAVIVRIHHCIADGIALIGVMLSLTDADPDAPVGEPLPRRSRGGARDPWTALLDPVTQATAASIKMTTAFWVKYLELLGSPDMAVRYGRHGIGLAAELVKLLALPADSDTRFKGKTGRPKRVAWSNPIPLDEVKAVGKPLGCSVNDVLLSAVAGALRSYLAAKGDPVDGVEVRAMVPVNMRSEADAGKLGNRFGLVTLLLPVYESNPFARLFEVRKRMNALKRSYLPPLSLGLLGAMGLMPKPVQSLALDILASKASAVMTNVPGPRDPLHLAGARIDQIMFWVPQSGDIGMGVSILSYANSVQFGLITDEGMVPDPDAIAPLFQREFESMVLALMLYEGGLPLDPRALEQSLEEEIELGALAGKPEKARKRKPAAAARIPAGDPAPAAKRIPRRFRTL